MRKKVLHFFILCFFIIIIVKNIGIANSTDHECKEDKSKIKSSVVDLLKKISISIDDVRSTCISDTEINECLKYLSALSDLELQDLRIKNMFTSMGRPLLIKIALLDERNHMLKRLIKAGWDINDSEKSYFMNTAIIWTIANAQNKNIGTLLECEKLDPSIADGMEGSKNTPLHLMLSKGDCHEGISDQGACIERKHVINIIEKISENKNEKIRNSINSKNAYGHTPLHLAILRRDVDMVRLLLKSGADKSLILGDKIFLTQLMNASSKKRTDMLEEEGIVIVPLKTDKDEERLSEINLMLK
ncbi:MAG: ankyrin repeat domain-containing protein [Oligoflexia bacterium]|nr:ankyrin repeat domain-containing protein [Oligoflexia bacterium]